MDSFDETLGEAAAIENDIQHLSLKELLNQRSGLSSRINHLTNEIGDLAFNNYRTYADAGRTAEHCKEMFSNIHNNINEVKVKMPKLVETVQGFSEKTKAFHKEYDILTSVTDRHNSLWKIIDMPKVMEQCIQSGEYDSAFGLTDFAVTLKNSKLYNYPIVKKPVDYVIEARHGLLDELFNKFTGPIDLSKSILVVNNIRKIPYISNTQLRVSILHYRDIYLDNLVAEAMARKQTDYIYKLIDIYRDCMYDTMVLYLAVFPDSDVQRRLATSNDPRWERWTGSSQNYLLQAWAHKNLDQLFEQIKVYTGSKINYEALREKLMSFASSFGRMGLDFRLLVLDEFRTVEIRVFQERVSLALMTLIEKQSLNLVDSEIVEMARSGLIQNNALDSTALPLDMIAWDDLVVYANEIINGLNDLRFSLAVNQVNDLFSILQNSFKQLVSWIGGFLESNEDAVSAKRAARIVIEHFIPFMQTHFTSCFAVPLQDKWRVKDEDDLSAAQEPFVFRVDCIAYEPTVVEEKKELSVNGYSNNPEVKQQSSPGLIPDVPQLTSFVNSFANQMSSIWTDEPPPEEMSEAAIKKAEKSQELNQRFEMAISELSKSREGSTQPSSETDSKKELSAKKIPDLTTSAEGPSEVVSSKQVLEESKVQRDNSGLDVSAAKYEGSNASMASESVSPKVPVVNDVVSSTNSVSEGPVSSTSEEVKSHSKSTPLVESFDTTVASTQSTSSPVAPSSGEHSRVPLDAIQMLDEQPVSEATDVSSENFSEPFSNATAYEEALSSSKTQPSASLQTMNTTMSDELLETSKSNEEAVPQKIEDSQRTTSEMKSALKLESRDFTSESETNVREEEDGEEKDGDNWGWGDEPESAKSEEEDDVKMKKKD